MLSVKIRATESPGIGLQGIRGCEDKGYGETKKDIERVCEESDIKQLGLVQGDAHNRDKWWSLTTGNRPTLPHCSNKDVVLCGLCSRYVKH